ncbi:MAG: pyruvate, phosphate dikinase [Nitrospinota bacterium]
MRSKRIYYFSKGKADGSAKMKNLLGGKGANLAELCNLNISTPAGFTITTKCSVEYYEKGSILPVGLKEEIQKNLRRLEKDMDKELGSSVNPLLLSVRSGSRASMPGMMDTVLNLGLNDKTVEALAASSGNRAFALDSYRRFITMFSDVALGVKRSKFEKLLDKQKQKRKINLDSELTVEDLEELISKYKKVVEKSTGKKFPADPIQQLIMAVKAVFNSWQNPRAIEYRKMYNIPVEWGTAVNVQSMVFGNLGSNSGTGVAFTRDPSSGKNIFFGEFLFNAQGEDVVAGIRTPLSLSKMGRKLPLVKKELDAIYKMLEKHYKDMLDIEFTVEAGKLYILQCRVGKRTCEAAIKIAVDLVKEKLIGTNEALQRIDPMQLDQLLHKRVDPAAAIDLLTRGLPASPGAGVGKVVFSSEEAVAKASKNEAVILVRHETSPDDIGGMNAARGILTSTGGMTSHAAVVARGMGRCCVAGAEAVHISEDQTHFMVGKQRVNANDWITLDGTTGKVLLGKAKLIEPKLFKEYEKFMSWADKARTLKVRANGDTEVDAKRAIDFKAEGIGLCRTEHMFFEGKRIVTVREMILAKDVSMRRKALAKLAPMQKNDFKLILKAISPYPVTIRLLDPPLHEFLPKREDEFKELSDRLKISVAKLKEKVDSLYEFNPMLGHRGCRLGITFPEIYQMQARAIFEATGELLKSKIKVQPEIMIPLVGIDKELILLREKIVEVKKEVESEIKLKMKIPIGTMIELPRAALDADKIASHADFFSFGTNDLTQTTFGFSRDDSGRFLPEYLEQGLLDTDPFVSIDQSGVGELIKIGVKKGKSTNKSLKVGICGEHGGDPASILFCHANKLDYVSCSPYRLPIARLAAAQAALNDKKSR